MNTPYKLVVCLCFVLVACEAEAPERSTDDTFHFVAQPSQDLCRPACSPKVVDMCDMTDNAELLLFVEVASSSHEVPPCEDQIYSSGGYWKQELRVLSVALGPDPGRTIDSIALRSFGVAEDAGDRALIGLRKLDGQWFRVAAAEIASAGDFVDVPDEDAGTVYDLPVSFGEFRTAAQATRADQQQACGFVWPKLSDDEFKARIYDVEECPDDPGPLPFDGDGGSSDPTDDSL